MKENIDRITNLGDFKLLILDFREHRKLYNESFECEYAIEIMDNILSDYQNALKENEDWQKAYQEEKEKQFELLRENQLAKQTLKKQCNIADERNQLLKENEELKHKYDKALSDLVKAEKETILAQKVKDKIEELKNKSGGNVFHIQQTINAEIDLLQDLLEEKGK